MARVGNLLLQVLTAFAMTPMIVGALGERRFGFWTIVCTVVGYYGLLDLGIHSAVCRYVASARQANDGGQVDEVVSTSLAMFSVLGVGVLALTAVAWPVCAHVLDTPEETRTLQMLVLILGIRTALGFPFRVYVAVLNADLRYDLTSIVAIVRLVVVNCMIAALLTSGYGLVGMALSLLAGSFMESALWVALCHRLYPELRIAFRKCTTGTGRALLDYSWKSLVIQVAGVFRLRLNAVIVGAFLNAGAVTHYAIGERLASYFIEFISSIIGNLSPLFSRYDGDRQGLLATDFRFVTRISVLITALTASTMVFYGAAFIDRWMGPQYRSSYHVMVILTVPLMVDLMQTPSIGLLYGTSRHHITAVLAVSGGLLNLALTLLLVRRWGVYGVAMATGVSVFLVKAILQPVWVCHAIGLSTRGYYAEVVGTMVRSLVPQLVYFAAVRGFVRPDYTRLLVLGLGQVATAIPTAVFWALPRGDLAVVANVIMAQKARRVVGRVPTRSRANDA